MVHATATAAAASGHRAKLRKFAEILAERESSIGVQLVEHLGNYCFCQITIDPIIVVPTDVVRGL